MSKSTDYKNEYNRVNYDRIGLTLPKGTGELWKAEAVRRNMSVNTFIQEAVNHYVALSTSEEK